MPAPFGATCHPVPEACCESMLTNLQKFCFSFKPAGLAVKVPDSSHWDGGDWHAPASFDSLCMEYLPSECERGYGKAPACARFLSFVARQYDADICKAVMTGQCDDICEHQCPPPSLALASSAAARYMGSQQKTEGEPVVCADGVCSDQPSTKDATTVSLGQEAQQVQHKVSARQMS